MANDITLAINDNPIKNGTLLVQCRKTGFSTNDINSTYSKNTPSLATIQSKYDNRFDDPSYYYGIGGSTIVGG